jgi:hypothetical protein
LIHRYHRPRTCGSASLVAIGCSALTWRPILPHTPTISRAVTCRL